MIPNEWKWALDKSVPNTITLQRKQTIFDGIIFTIDCPSEMLCRWIALSNNVTSCTDLQLTCLRVMCLLSRCIQNSSEFFNEGIVLTLSNVVSLLGLSIYLDSIWVEDCPRGYDHWTKILRCSRKRMVILEANFIHMLRYRLHVSDNQMQSFKQKINDTYKSHLFVTRQPVLNNQAKEVTDNLSDVKHIREQPVQVQGYGDEHMNFLLCTEMSVE